LRVGGGRRKSNIGSRGEEYRCPPLERRKSAKKGGFLRDRHQKTKIERKREYAKSRGRGVKCLTLTSLKRMEGRNLVAIPMTLMNRVKIGHFIV